MNGRDFQLALAGIRGLSETSPYRVMWRCEDRPVFRDFENADEADEFALALPDEFLPSRPYPVPRGAHV